MTKLGWARLALSGSGYFSKIVIDLLEPHRDVIIVLFIATKHKRVSKYHLKKSSLRIDEEAQMVNLL